MTTIPLYQNNTLFQKARRIQELVEEIQPAPNEISDVVNALFNFLGTQRGEEEVFVEYLDHYFTPLSELQMQLIHVIFR